MKSGSLDTANIGCILNCNSLMVKNARREGRPPSAYPSLYLYIWGSVRALSCPIVGRMLLRPYASSSRFLSVKVGAYCIRPIRRPRQGDECGFWVMSMGHLLGASGPYPSSAMGWGLAPTGPHMPIPIYMGKPSGPYHSRFGGVCNTPLPCRSIVFIQMGRAQQHTPHKTSPLRGRMRVPGYFAG